MTQTQTQTPQKQNSLAALDQKVADGIAADKAATQPQPALQQGPDKPAVQSPQLAQQQAQAEPQKQPDAAAKPVAQQS